MQKGRFFHEVNAGTEGKLSAPLVKLIISYADRYNIRDYNAEAAKKDQDLLAEIQKAQKAGNAAAFYAHQAQTAATMGYIESLAYLLKADPPQKPLVDVTQTSLLPSAVYGSEPGVVQFLLDEHRECLKTLTLVSSENRHTIFTVMLQNARRMKHYPNDSRMNEEREDHQQCRELLSPYIPLVINIAWMPQDVGLKEPTTVERPTPLHLAIEMEHPWSHEILFLGACTDQNNVQAVTKWMCKKYAGHRGFLTLLQAQAVHDKDNKFAESILEDKQIAPLLEKSDFKPILKYYKEIKEETGWISKKEPVWNTHARVFNEAKSNSLVDKVVAVLEQKSNDGVYKNLRNELLAKKAEFDREEKPAKKLLEFLSNDKDKTKPEKPFDEVLFVVRSLLWDAHTKQMKEYIAQQSKALAAELAALPKPGEASKQQAGTAPTPRV